MENGAKIVRSSVQATIVFTIAAQEMMMSVWIVLSVFTQRSVIRLVVIARLALAVFKCPERVEKAAGTDFEGPSATKHAHLIVNHVSVMAMQRNASRASKINGVPTVKTTAILIVPNQSKEASQ